MHPIIKFSFTILGAVLIGFGLGILAHKNNILSAGQFEVAIIMSLIGGGFFLALGIPARKARDNYDRESSSSSSSPT